MTSHEEAKAFWLNIWRVRPEYKDELNSNAYVTRTKAIIEILGSKIQNTETFCELGVGPGRNIFYFHEAYPEWKYIGNDINPDTHSVIEESYPGMLDYADITIADTLDYLKQIDPVDTLFTHGHLMHISDETIDEICELMAQKARKYIVMHEALGHMEQHAECLHKNFRFERKYSFPGFLLEYRRGELATNTGMIYAWYLFRKEQS